MKVLRQHLLFNPASYLVEL